MKIAVKSQNSLTESVSNETNAMLVENEKLLKYFKFRVDTDFNIEDSKDKSSEHFYSSKMNVFNSIGCCIQFFLL